MAVVAVDDSNLRRQDMEGAVSGTTNIGAGAGVFTFAEAIYQGAQTWGRKANAANALRGFFVTVTTIDMTVAGDEVLMWKGNIVNSAAIDVLGVRGRIGSSTTAYFEYFLRDDGIRGDIDYPIVGGWLIEPVDPNVPAWRDIINGSPTLTAVVEIGINAAVNIVTVNENIIFDAIDFGPGLFLVGGDGADPDGVLQDFIDDDEGTLTAGRFGHVATREGIIFVFGKLVFGRTGGGTVTATVFNDQNQTLVFPGGRVDAGWNELEIDLGNASTDVDWTNITVIGRGRDNIKRWFDSADEVDGTNEEIDIVGHGIKTGDTVLYSTEGGTAVSGLTDATEFFARAVTDDAVALYAMSGGRDNAYTDTSRINLTAAGTGQQHSLRRTPDTRPDITVIGTTGVGFTATSCSLQNLRNITLTSKALLDRCAIVGLASAVLAQGKLDTCTIEGATTSEGEALVSTPDLSDISDCIFTASPEGGHAVEIDTAGTYSYVGNTHAGYGPARQDFNASTDVGANTITLTGHPYADGDAVYYSDEGGTQIVGLTDQTRYYANSVDANTVSLHATKQDATSDTNRIGLTAGSSETHTLYSANAALLNSSGGAVTVNVSGAASPTVRNTAGSTTTVNNNVAVTFDGMRDNSEVWVFPTGVMGEGNEIAMIENATAGTPDNRNFTWSAGAAVEVDYVIHNFNPTGPDYQTIRVNGFTVPGAAVTIGIQQVLDRNSVD